MRPLHRASVSAVMRARRPVIDVGRERSDIPAHLVEVLTLNGPLQVVRTRKVRAMQERFSGRTARLFYVAALTSGEVVLRDVNDFAVAAHESSAAYEDGKLWGFIRHGRISPEQASAFWERIAALVEELTVCRASATSCRLRRQLDRERERDPTPP